MRRPEFRQLPGNAILPSPASTGPPPSYFSIACAISFWRPTLGKSGYVAPMPGRAPDRPTDRPTERAPCPMPVGPASGSPCRGDRSPQPSWLASTPGLVRTRTRALTGVARSPARAGGARAGRATPRHERGEAAADEPPGHHLPRRLPALPPGAATPVALGEAEYWLGSVWGASSIGSGGSEKRVRSPKRASRKHPPESASPERERESQKHLLRRRSRGRAHADLSTFRSSPACDRPPAEARSLRMPAPAPARHSHAASLHVCLFPAPRVGAW